METALSKKFRWLTAGCVTSCSRPIDHRNNLYNNSWSGVYEAHSDCSSLSVCALISFLFVFLLRQDFLGRNRSVETQDKDAEGVENVEPVAVADLLPVCFVCWRIQPTNSTR